MSILSFSFLFSMVETALAHHYISTFWVRYGYGLLLRMAEILLLKASGLYTNHFGVVGVLGSNPNIPIGFQDLG
jgi:hypothetical protein